MWSINSISIDITAREAYKHSYNQIFVDDAMTDAIIEEHSFILKYIFPRIGKIRTSEEAIQKLK